jgi:sec-independent protein translocase protein TatA
MRGREGKSAVHPVLAEIFGPDLIIVIIVLAVVLFGGSQIPKLARSLGSAQSEFKKGLAEGAGKSDQAGTAPTGPTTADSAPPSDEPANPPTSGSPSP